MLVVPHWASPSAVWQTECRWFLASGDTNWTRRSSHPACISAADGQGKKKYGSQSLYLDEGNRVTITGKESSASCVCVCVCVCTWLCSCEASLACCVSRVSGRVEYRELVSSFFPASLYFIWNRKINSLLHLLQTSLKSFLPVLI